MKENEKKGCMHSVWIGWIRICRMINDFVENLFEAHTRFITSHHHAIIIACLIFVAFCGAGAWRFTALQRNEELFIPQGSRGFLDLDKGEKYFQLKFRVQEFIMKFTDNSNVFDKNTLFAKALQLHNEVIALKNFDSTCLKTSKTNTCLFISGLEVFDYNMANVVAANNSIKIKNALNKYYQNRKLTMRNGRTAFLNFPNIFGNFKGAGMPDLQDNRDNVQVISSNAIRMTYYSLYADTDDDNYGMITNWEDEYISLCGDKVDALEIEGIELFYFAARTRDDAILSSTVGDLPLFSVAFILMVAFCLFVFLRIKEPVNGHLTVGICGIFVIMLGVGCGFGLAMWIGTDFVAFTGILMFLILGIGMDNMFIIVDALQSVDPDVQGPERLVIAMKHVGGSITMTTSTDLVAFAVSTVSDFPAVHLFCVYAALSIFFAYAMLVTLFLALLTADINRMESGKRDVFPCCSVEGYNENPWKSNYESLLKKALRKWGEIIMTTPGKVIIFLSACGLLAVGIYGTTQITQKFEWKKLAPDGSYFRKFAEARDGNFPAGYDVSIIIPPTQDYLDKSTQQKIIALNTIANNNQRFEQMTLNWMNVYLNIYGNRPYFDFYGNLSTFLADYPEYAADINRDKTTGKIDSSRVVFFYENNNDATNQAEAMKGIRKDLEDNSTIPGIFPISIMFIYAEQFAAVVDDTVRNLAICAGTILVITLPYLTHPGITGLVFLSFTALLFELLGLMAAWDVSLDAVAMVIIIMAIGFSVDYTCHIAHSYMISQKDTPELRVIDALQTMGTSVLNGGVSTFLGMLITAFSGAEGFRIFFKMVFGIVALGLIHGLVFLPVILSIFIRRDLREDMKEFVEKHDEKDRRKSKRRFSTMTEGQKRKQSVSYRLSSLKSDSDVNFPTNDYQLTDDVTFKNVRKLEDIPDAGVDNNDTPVDRSSVGSPNSAYQTDENPVFVYDDNQS